MVAVVNSFSIKGIDAYVVEIETDTIYGQPSISIVGLGDTAVKEARERLEAAIVHAKYEFPKMKIVINLAPCDIKKRGSHFDLGMAIGLLKQTDQITVEDIGCYGFIGELSLNAKLRPCSGVLPMAVGAKNRGINNLIVPEDNVKEASLVKGINVFGFDGLTDVVEFLQKKTEYKSKENKEKENTASPKYLVDFSEVQGQDAVIEFVVAAAAGGHNMILSGPPGCGKSMIAKRIPTILPEMNENEALEVTKIYSICGLLKNKGSLITDRPFRAPHHNASSNSLVGGGNNAMPGEVSLAHNGVLFLDEVAEFGKMAIDGLRQPLEDQKITISRVSHTNSYPASFMLVAAMNPCPCGYYGYSRCRCSDYEVLKYRRRISGPILDRIDIQKFMQPVDFIKLTIERKGVSSKELRERVAAARKIQNERFKDIENVHCNAQMSSAQIKEFCTIDEESRKLLKRAFEKFQYSARTYDKFLKIARTFADLDKSKKVRKEDIAKALLCRDLDKEQARMVVI